MRAVRRVAGGARCKLVRGTELIVADQPDDRMNDLFGAQSLCDGVVADGAGESSGEGVHDLALGQGPLLEKCEWETNAFRCRPRVVEVDELPVEGLPGGYTLPEAGISLAGRGVVLDINYRNTAEILQFASRLVDGDEFSDIEGVVARGDRPASVVRSGPAPVHVRCGSWAERDRHLVERVREVTREVGNGPGDVGVLCLSNRAADAVAAALRAAGLPVVMLTEYDGAAVDAVKVGTVKRAKGLEFKHVLIADATLRDGPGAAVPSDPAERERWELRRRELYVGMTRARDGLWVAVV